MELASHLLRIFEFIRIFAKESIWQKYCFPLRGLLELSLCTLGVVGCQDLECLATGALRYDVFW